MGRPRNPPASTAAPVRFLAVKAALVIRAARCDAGKSQDDIASAMNITQTSLSRIETGEVALSLAGLLTVAQTCERPPAELLAEILATPDDAARRYLGQVQARRESKIRIHAKSA